MIVMIDTLSLVQLFCCFSATFILNMILTVYSGGDLGFLNLGSPGLVDFGVFSRVSNRRS